MQTKILAQFLHHAGIALLVHYYFIFLYIEVDFNCILDLITFLLIFFEFSRVLFSWEENSNICN